MLFWGFLFAMSRKVSCSWIAGSRWSTSARVVWTSPPEGHLLSGHLRVFLDFFLWFLFIKNHWVTFEESCSRFFLSPMGTGMGVTFRSWDPQWSTRFFRYHKMSQKSVIFGWIQHKNGSMFYSFFRSHFNPFHLCQGTLRTSATSSMRGSHCAVAPWQSGLCPRRGWNGRESRWTIGTLDSNTWTNSPGALHIIPYYRHL